MMPSLFEIHQVVHWSVPCDAFKIDLQHQFVMLKVVLKFVGVVVYCKE